MTSADSSSAPASATGASASASGTLVHGLVGDLGLGDRVGGHGLVDLDTRLSGCLGDLVASLGRGLVGLGGGRGQRLGGLLVRRALDRRGDLLHGAVLLDVLLRHVSCSQPQLEELPLNSQKTILPMIRSRPATSAIMKTTNAMTTKK